MKNGSNFAVNNIMKIHCFKVSQHMHSDNEVERALNSVLSNQNIGFLTLPYREDLINQSRALGHDLKNKYDHLVVVGIGGSSMGARAFTEIAPHTKITFFDNPDTKLASEILILLKNKEQKIGWLFVSKSGTTIEVLWCLEWIDQQYKILNRSLWEDTYYITELTQNTLHKLSIEHKRPCLEIPLNVGGRYSVLSPVGLVVAAYLGFSLEKITSGAQQALKDKQTLKILVDQYLSSFERGENISLFWFYSSYMRWFGGWLQQLWAESLGKKQNRKGKSAFEFSTPMAAIGTYDQHSILQQVIEGPKNKFVAFFRFNSIEQGVGLQHTSANITKSLLFKETKMLNEKKFGDLIRAEALATQKGLELSGVSTLMYELNALDEETMSFLFMQFQLLVAVLAEVKDVDAFNQPGVQLGKTLVFDMLKGL
ncbi:MAG: glucose-6-phosphate isomerase [Pseudobdellovibrio sp.]